MASKIVAAFCFPLVSNSGNILPRMVQWGLSPDLALRAPHYSSISQENRLWYWGEAQKEVQKRLCNVRGFWQKGWRNLLGGLWRVCWVVPYWAAPQRKGDRRWSQSSAAAAETSSSRSSGPTSSSSRSSSRCCCRIDSRPFSCSAKKLP